jgi:hypothetical protein
MKILMLETLSGIDYVLNAGEVVDRPDAEAIRFIAAGIASAVLEPSSRETATKPVRLRAVKE